VLSLVAGPFTRALSPFSLNPFVFPSMGAAYYSYDDPVGIFCLYPSTGLAYTVMQLDGTVDARSRNLGLVNAFILDQQTNGWIVCSGSSLADLSTWDVENGVPGAAPFFSGISFGQTLAVQVRCADRYLKFYIPSSGVLRAATSSFADPNTYTTETDTAASVSHGGGTPITVSRSGGSQLVLCSPNGEVRKYDTAAKAFLNYVAFLPVNLGAWYSPTLGVYVVLTGTLSAPTVAIYADVPVPYALSNPVPASALTVGRVTSVSVTLTGQQGEPCPDELIEWTLVSGSGSLDAIQSTTDSNGTAAVNYVAPLSLGTNPTIAADVVF
jgi:hypothetical protein